MDAIVVTGGAGFIGSSLVRSLLERTGAVVVNIDKLTYASVPASLEDLADNPRYRFERADIVDGQAVQEIIAKYRPFRVFHLAAESHVDRSIESAGVFVRTNVSGTCALLQQCLDFWSSLPADARDRFRFVHISTDEVYGELPHPDDDSDEASRARTQQERFSEDSVYAPNSPYSASKAASDHFVRAWHRTYGLPVLIANCSNNYGPRQFPEKLIPRIILNARSGQSLPVFGAGNQIRDWLYVQDHIDALMRIAADGRVGQGYNIGADNEQRNLDIVRIICQILEELAPDKPDGVSRYDDLITHIRDRPGHDRRYAVDAGKIFRELGWKPKVSFDEGLRRTVSWYLANPRWCQSALARATAQNQS